MAPRTASPLKSDRSPKRSKTASPSSVEEPDMPDNIADIVSDGDGLLVLGHGLSTAPGTPISLRVSTHALSLASAIFKAQFARAVQDEQIGAGAIVTLRLPDEDGDAMYLLCHILHLRNDKLPTRLAPSLLRRVGLLARKYNCVIAAARATSMWFDNLYFADDPGNIWEIVEAAYLWDEATYFARFTSKWVLKQSMFAKTIEAGTTQATQRLAVVMAEKLSVTQTLLRNDIDSLVEPCAHAFSDQASHYIDYPPGLSPSISETPTGQPPTSCSVDPEGAKLYLGSLRDVNIWPSTTWARPSPENLTGTTISSLVDKIKEYKEPEYDDTDRCDGCAIVKIQFTEQLEVVQEALGKRLWGVCLDCYGKSSGGNDVECRYEHAK